MNTNHLKLGIWALLASSSLGLMAAQEPIVRYKILANSPEQHIQHFGASDAWSMQFLGTLAREAATENCRLALFHGKRCAGEA